MPEANETKHFECDQDKPFFHGATVTCCPSWSCLYVQVRINHLSLGFGWLWNLILVSHCHYDNVATALIRWICSMQLAFRLNKWPGESHLAFFRLTPLGSRQVQHVRLHVAEMSELVNWRKDGRLLMRGRKLVVVRYILQCPHNSGESHLALTEKECEI